jgi:Cu+-exporting ATPase
MASTSTFASTAPPLAQPGAPARAEAAHPPCFHCGTLCRDHSFRREEKRFCCHGCLTVFELLTENGLADFYSLSPAAGVRVDASPKTGQFKYLDEPAVRERLVDYSDEKLTRVTFHIPAIHCVACVWLLENLFQLHPGIGQSQVNFPRKEAAIAFRTGEIKLSGLVALLASLGYEPELKLSALDARPRRAAARRLWIQLGLAGFAFGNIMLFSISSYLGLDAFAGPAFRKLFGAISLLLTLPTITYAAGDYWRAAWTSLRQRLLNIDVPIAAGLAAIFLQSAWEVLSGRGDGYFDSLNGLIFFLLCGRWFQQKTYDRLAFDRDYKSFFPLAVSRVAAGDEEEQISLSQLAVGDRLVIRNGELIPADARLLSEGALVDYSFVTGESEPAARKCGDHLYAGGRQMGGAIVAEIVKPVSQSYLTSLWNQEAFRKEPDLGLKTLTNRYSQRFTRIIIAIAAGSALFWAFANPALSLKAFTSVLIVACPCALALAAPFALGSAQRLLSRRHVFLKNPLVLETLANVDAVVFDKTGTLTAAGAGAVDWRGAPLTAEEERWIFSLARNSAHPLAARVAGATAKTNLPDPVRSFQESSGGGIEGVIFGHNVRMGSAVWLNTPLVEASPASHHPLNPNPLPAPSGSVVHVAIDHRYRGCFSLAHALRPDTGALVEELNAGTSLALLSGDNDREQARFKALLGDTAELRFNQSPLDKLNFIKAWQDRRRTVMMVGDGLNDAGALKQSDVGVAVVESMSGFSPASDVILKSDMVARLGGVLRYSKQSIRVVRAAFLISTAYNVVGVAIAASGRLSPVVCAILMPLSSVSVVAFACLATTFLGRHLKPREARA